MASDSWRYPWTMLPDYMGPGTPVEQYQRKRAELVTTGPEPAQKPVPAATRNAVATATDGEAIPRGGETTARGTPSIPGIEKLNRPGLTHPQLSLEPVYPSAEQEQMRRGAANATSGFDFGLPRMMARVPALSPGGYSDEVPPVRQSALDQEADIADQRSADALGRGGIADIFMAKQWARRGRRLRAAALDSEGNSYRRIAADASMLGARAAALRAENEMPIEYMRLGSRRRDQDVQLRAQDIGQRGDDLRYLSSMAGHQASMSNAERAAQAQELGSRASLARFVPQMQIDDMTVRALQSGDFSLAQYLSVLGKFPPAERNPTMVVDPMGGGVWSARGSEMPTLTTAADAKAAAAAASRRAAEEEAARRLKEGR